MDQVRLNEYYNENISIQYKGMCMVSDIYIYISLMTPDLKSFFNLREASRRISP